MQQPAPDKLLCVYQFPNQQNTLSISLRVQDLISSEISEAVTVNITLDRASQLPPVMTFHQRIQSLLLAANQSSVKLNLNALKSLSPNEANDLSFTWNYLGTDDVFLVMRKTLLIKQ